MNIELLDCTIRDGGYINNWNFTDDLVSNCYETLNNSNINYMEVGFFNKKTDYKDTLVGKWFNLDNNIVNKTISKKTCKLVAMIDNANKDLSLITEAKDSPIDMFRVAFHKKEYTDALSFCQLLKTKKYKVCANAMATQNYTDAELEELIKLVVEYNIDYLYIADSYGCLYPEDLETIIGQYKHLRQKYHGKFKLGVHLHNNLDNALSNAIICIKNNIDIIDSTIFGMGRGAGNLTTESLICYLLKNATTNLILQPVLKFAQTYITPIYSSKMTSWGYNLLYVLSAYHQVHPNYINKLIDLSITDVDRVNNILIKLKEQNQHMYFNKSINLLLE